MNSRDSPLVYKDIEDLPTVKEIKTAIVSALDRNPIIANTLKEYHAYGKYIARAAKQVKNSQERLFEIGRSKSTIDSQLDHITSLIDFYGDRNTIYNEFEEKYEASADVMIRETLGTCHKDYNFWKDLGTRMAFDIREGKKKYYRNKYQQEIL